MAAPSRLSGVRRVIAGAALALALAAVAAGCGGDSDDSGTTPDSVTSVSVLVDVLPAVLDPGQSSSTASSSLLIALEPLVRYDHGNFEPLLASEVTSPDPTTYVITIRDGVTFWDGSPFTAGDAAFSLGLHTAEGTTSINATLFAHIASIDVTGDSEVTIKLHTADPQFTGALAQVGMVSKAFYEANGDQVGTQEVLNLGTGPYEFEAFTPSKEVELTANGEYWGERKPQLEAVTLGVISDDAARLNALQSGEYDGMLGVPISQVDAIAGLDDLQLAENPDATIYKFDLNVEMEPWDDIHLRRAFQLALNREAIVEGALSGKAQLAPTLVPESIMSGLAGEEVTEAAYGALEDDIEFDPDAAREEMAQSSVPDGVSAEVLVTGSDPTLALVVQTAAQDLAKVGIELTVREVDDQTYYSSTFFGRQHDGVVVDQFSASTPDPSNVPLYVINGANAQTQGGTGINMSDYVNPQVDTLLEESQQLGVDDPERGAKLLEALATAQADVPYVPMAFPNVYLAGRSGLDVDNLDVFWWMSQWPEDLVAS